MAISIKMMKNKFAPVIICDVCNIQITDAKTGNYEWTISPDGEHIIGPVFTHKEKCSHKLEYIWRERYPNYVSMWEGLKILPLYLRNNLNLKEKDLKEAAKFAAVFE